MTLREFSRSAWEWALVPGTFLMGLLYVVGSAALAGIAFVGLLIAGAFAMWRVWIAAAIVAVAGRYMGWW